MGVEKKTKGTKSKFSFNNRDYSREEDYTDICLKNIGLLDGLVDVKTSRAQEHMRRRKRQEEAKTVDKVVEAGSIFSEADFEAISRLHFVNSQKAVIVDE